MCIDNFTRNLQSLSEITPRKSQLQRIIHGLGYTTKKVRNLLEKEYSTMDTITLPNYEDILKIVFVQDKSHQELLFDMEIWYDMLNIKDVLSNHMVNKQQEKLEDLQNNIEDEKENVINLRDTIYRNIEFKEYVNPNIELKKDINDILQGFGEDSNNIIQNSLKVPLINPGTSLGDYNNQNSIGNEYQLSQINQQQGNISRNYYSSNQNLEQKQQMQPQQNNFMLTSVNSESNQNLMSKEKLEEQDKLEQKKKLNMQKLMNAPSQYRIAMPSKQSVESVSQRFWDDINKNNKQLQKFSEKKQQKRPYSTYTGGFYNNNGNNDQLEQNYFSNKQEQLIQGQFSGQNENQNLEEQYDIDMEIETAAQQANSQVTFQRNLTSKNTPYSFLSSVGGKNTALSIYTQETDIDKEEQIKKKQKDQKYQVTGEETLEIYKKIDIDKAIKPQITVNQKKKQAQRPQTVSTINQINIDGMINESKQQQNKTRSKQQSGRQLQSQARNEQILIKNSKNQKRVQTAHVRIKSAQSQLSQNQLNTKQKLQQQYGLQNYQSNKSISSSKPGSSQSNRIQSAKTRQMSAISLQPQGSQPQLQSQGSKVQMMKMLQENNQKIMQKMQQDQGDIQEFEDQDSFIQDDLGEDQEFYDQSDLIKGMQSFNKKPSAKSLNRTKSALAGKRPISGNSVGPQQFFQKFQKYTTFNALDIPYENLFDRNERTYCATFAKFGDLGFYSPVQRIGAYMEYCAKLKLSHLKSIISLQKTITNIDKNPYQIPIQLAIVNDLDPYQFKKKDKIGISTSFNQQDFIREPVTLSLFPEYFEDEDDFVTTTELAGRYFIDMLSEMGGVYDPEYLGKRNYPYIDPESYPEEIKKTVEASVGRYNHYLESEIINADEIPKFQKKWLLKALNWVQPELLSQEDVYKKVFQEILENFKIAMKKAMLDYVLLCPMERARLHIQLVPRPVLCSSERIAREGGFNIKLFDDWHNYVENGREFCKGNLVQMNLINSSLVDWFHEFSHFRLVETQSLHLMKILNYTLNIQEFVKLQELYRLNVISLFKYVWHRGSLLIIKQFKHLRRKGLKRAGQWSFLGYENKQFKIQNQQGNQAHINIQQQMESISIGEEQQIQQEPSSEYIEEQDEEYEQDSQNQNNLYYRYADQESNFKDHIDIPQNLEYLRDIEYIIQNNTGKQQVTSEDVFKEIVKYFIESQNINEEFDRCDDLTSEDLPDIRESPAYRTLAQLSGEDEQVWKEENGWKLYTKEYKAKILKNVGIKMGLQLREIVEHSIEQLKKLFLDIPTIQTWKNQQRNFNQQFSTLYEGEQSSYQQFEENTVQQNLSKEDQLDPSQSEINITNISNVKSPLQQQQQQQQQGQSKKSISSKIPSQSHISPTMNNMGTSGQGYNSRPSIQKLGTFLQRQPSQQKQGLTLHQMGKSSQEMEFSLPQCLNFKGQQFESILNLSMTIENDQIQFEEQRDQIKQTMGQFFRQLVGSMNHFLHPQICKIKENTNYEEFIERNLNDKRNHAWQCNLDQDNATILDDFDDFYRTFIPFIQLTEKQGKNNNIYQQNEEQQNHHQNSQEQLADRLLTGMGIDSKSRYLQVVNAKEEIFLQSENQIIQHILEHYDECQMTFKIFDQFKLFINGQAEKEIKKVIQKKQQLQNEEMKLYYNILTQYIKLLDQVPDHVYLPLFDVNCIGVKQELAQRISKLRKNLEQSHMEVIYGSIKVLTDKYGEIDSEIRKSTNTAEEVENMEKYINDLFSERASLKSKTQTAFQKLNYLLKLNINLDEYDRLFSLAKDLHEWPFKLDKNLKDQEEKHALERENLEKALREQRFTFETRVEVELENLNEFEQQTEYKLYADYVIKVREFEKKLEDQQQLMEEIISQETKLFGFPSNFEKFQNLRKNFEPYSKLWKSVDFFVESKKKWTQGPISNLDLGEIEVVVKEQNKTSNKLQQIFSETMVHRVSDKFREEVMDMHRQLNAIEIITRPGLKERHWKEISDILDMPMINPQEVTLMQLNQFNLDECIKQVEEISENASKEFSLESALDKMEKEWENLAFVVLEYKSRGVLILQGQAVEEIQILLDDHTLKAQTIKQNPNIKFMETRATRWEEQMTYTQKVLEVWIKVQTLYLYLEPIFSFEDISKTLKSESEKFAIVDEKWKEIMKVVHEDPIVLNCVNKFDRLLSTLNNCLSMIEEIQKGLEEHLESKRLDFPRFFFLSNDDLLNILAETKDPLLVQPHMKKCFEGISELIFNSNVDIMGMKSSEKEEINFISRISPRNYKSNVERWLLKVQDQMKQSLMKQMEDSKTDLYQQIQLNKRDQWVKRWPGQVILCINQVNWTQSVEEALRKSQNNQNTQELQVYYQDLEQQKNLIVNMVRQNLSNLEMMTLSALIVIAVHNNDVVKTMLEDDIQNVEDFEWQSQMRYEWNNDTNIVNVKMMNTQQDYEYEYLGNTSRLVITPLTDRCYRTLMSALHLNLGGAPEGPAGTGKTETTKDLAKALAIQCIVFNCSEGLNIHSMAKFFKGLIATGAWSCFDEFNRIDVEVLSVIAQQILSIQQAKALQKHEMNFYGTDLNIVYSCSVFITMNPGYAGRSELPDNLKALFRSVAMMVPDYAMIAEIQLYSFGFLEARSLAKKIVIVYKLCSEQLSTQDHYDYGMRAVKAVLTTAQQLKRKYPLEKEEILILRSICDVNIPKFLTQDLSLFNGITSDLFPGTKLPQPEYTVLNNAMNIVLQQKNLQVVNNFKKKVLQLYEVVNTRHGLMIVGQPFSGKTMCYQVLAATLGQAKLMGAHEEQTYFHVINPKSISIRQLYGDSDPVSKEWTEGILSGIYRKCATNTSSDRQFLVFDGPVDAEWIENMNTVLDDNKKLCLNNGETIAMTNYMTMMFEVADLKQASPATVSRCGMVYMQPDQLGWKPIFQSWLQTIQQDLDEITYTHIDELFDALVDRCIHFCKHKCKEYQPVPESALVVALMRLFECMLRDHNMLDKSLTSKLKPEELINRIDMLFQYSLVWTISSTIDASGRQNFDKYFKKTIKEAISCQSLKNKLIKFEKPAQIPDAGPQVMVYDYYIQKDDFLWKKWKDFLDSKEQEIPVSSNYNNIVIETVEMLRITDLLQKSIVNNIPFMLIGPTGTGKSTYINKYLKELPIDKFSLIFVNFSAQTSSEKTQDIIDTRLDRRRKGQYGPKLGMKCLIFIDDVNMPQYDKYGSQPPIELVRQFLDHGGWYGKDKNMMQIIDTQLLCAMGPPGGGRNFVTPRFLRHFNTLCTVESNSNELQLIFTSLMKWHLNKNEFQQDFQEKYQQCVVGAIEMYEQICQNLKPTPAKSVYLFNQRDISRVVQGMMLLDKRVLANDQMKISRLWINELSRVFFDRLIFEDDKVWFYNTLLHIIRNKLKEDIKNVVKGVYDHYKLNLLTYEPINVIRFGEIMANEVDDNKLYDEITQIQPLTEKIEYFLDDYNQNTKRPMKLVLFEFAVDHILRIVRILRTQQGHGLLIGLGGSGRQSMTMIAAHIRDIQLQTIEITKSYGKENWIEDMQKLLVTAGADQKETIFMISDAQISPQNGFILEDLNNLLNSGDIPSLFSQEDFIPLIDKLRTQAKKEGRTKLLDSGSNEKYYDYFIECVKNKLHTILVMSPIGDTLRNRIRMFPNLVNCTTIIQYTQWPEQGLEAVAHKRLQEMSLESQLQRKIMNICKNMHMSSIELSKEYLQKEQRHNYITPSSYLELLNNLQEQLHIQKQKLEDKKLVYSNGVDKILATSAQVKQMEEELQEKRPFLIKMNQETQEIAETIAAQAKSMEPKKIEVEEYTNLVQHEVTEAEKINNECEKELSVAKPKLERAEKALDTLDVNDIINLRSMLKPPNTVRLVMEAICVFLEVPPVKVGRAGMPKDKMYDYWESAKKLLQEKMFLANLINYDKNNIKPEIMKKIREKYVVHSDFNPKRVEKASSAAKGLCEWILAMDEYEKVLTIVRPKQEKYNESQKKVKQLQINLKKTQSELDELNKEIQKLEDQHSSLKFKQDQLEKDIQDCEQKLIRAESIIGGLGGEQERWKITSEKLHEQLQYIVGDVIISIGIVSYLGNFTQVYRNKQVQQWTQLLKENNVLVSENYSLESTFGEKILIRRWQMFGLPSDSFSTENGIITYTTKRWPLFVDPQGQAARWIKANESDNKVIITKQTDSGFIRNLENCITFGQVLVIENVKEDIDQILDPILAKQTFKNAGILSIKVGDNIVEYSRNFKLFMMTKLSRPHFTPEISTKMTLVNFGITKEGLIDQLLELCIEKEEPEDGEMRNKLIVQGHKNSKQLEEIEHQILQVLNKADNILEDEEGVKILQQSKEIANDIEEKQQVAKEIETRIEHSRQSYKPIANHSSVLFFTLIDLAQQDFMYQYSLSWFLTLYTEAFNKAQKIKKPQKINNIEDATESEVEDMQEQQSLYIQERVSSVISYFTYSFYCNVCRSLFEKDKLLFSFLLQIRLLESQNQLNMDEFQFFISPTNTNENSEVPEACGNWMPESTWLRFVALSKVGPQFSSILQCVQDNAQQWKEIYYDPEAHNHPLPPPYNSCGQLQKLCILKCIRPDRIVRASVNMIKTDLGEKFTNPPPFNLHLSFGDSNWYQPLVFVLPGTDPMVQLLAYSSQKNQSLESISLGQGQGIFAEKAIREARDNGTWVILQNCHLAPSWMPKLERICEEMVEISQNQILKDKQNENFRLFLTSYPSITFPVSILQNSVKMTNEPPKGLKSNLTVSFMSDQIKDPEFFDNHPKNDEFKSLLYGLCFFHAILQERRTFGPLGWNIHYDFNQSDLRISVRQLHLFMKNYSEIPYKALHYMIGECNYGGRVTDDRDRRILKALMSEFFSGKILEPGFKFAEDTNYPLPPIGSHDDYIRFIEDIPSITPSHMFGFHQNAEIVKDIQETDELCTSLLLLTGGNSSKSQANENQDEQIQQLIQKILDQLPKKFETEVTETKYPIEYKNSMNTVLQQEIIRYNNLTSTIKNSLTDLQKAIEGTVVMSESLEQVGLSLQKGLVPHLWKKNSYPSLKPLGGYIKDLIDRLNYFHQWIDDKPHLVHWMSGYYFTQAFLTATSQNYARKYQIPIDTLVFEFDFFDEPDSENIEQQGDLYKNQFDDGSLTYGLYLEGCSWDYGQKVLKESDPKVLFTKAPIILIKPIEITNQRLNNTYQCPVYKTSERKGTLSTTGHSTNFIMNIDIPTDQSELHWVKRGVALLCQLSE